MSCSVFYWRMHFAGFLEIKWSSNFEVQTEKFGAPLVLYRKNESGAKTNRSIMKKVNAAAPPFDIPLEVDFELTL